MTYVPLWTKSNFSFLEGASHPSELIERAHELGLDAVALTDRDGVYGLVRGHVAARESGVRLILGSQVTVAGGDRIVLLSQDREGYANLCRLLTKGRLRCAKGESRVEWDEVYTHAEGLLALWMEGGDPAMLKEAYGDRLYAMLARHRRADEVRAEAERREIATRHALPTVASVEVLYHTSARRPLQDVLTCLRHKVTLPTAGRLIQPNAEHELRTAFSFRELFEDLPGAVERTREVAERCRFSLDEIRYRYPSEKLPDGKTSGEWLEELTWKGAATRYPDGVPDKVRGLIRKELALIGELDYDGYFLTMWEIVRFCREQGILCQGRGSAANSAVCYCLGVTAVDPARIDLLFERFLSKERAEPPDIDLDIAHERREEVIQHVYDKYGRTTRRWSPTSSATAALGDPRRRQGARPAGDVARPARQAPQRYHDEVDRRAAAPRRARSGKRGCTAISWNSSRTDPGFPAPPVDPPRRLPARSRTGARHRADRERHDGGPHRHPVGQGRRRGHRAVQGRLLGLGALAHARPHVRL